MICERFEDHINLCENCYCDHSPHFVVKEKKSTYQLDNPTRTKICKIKIDGCFITGPSPRCDYLLVACDSKIVIFVELKGSNLLRAIEQIDQTMTTLEQQTRGACSINARIVLSSFNAPNLKNHPSFLGLIQRLKKRHGDLKYRCNPFDDKIPDPIP